MIPQVEDNLDTIVIYIISDVLEIIPSGILKDKRFKFLDEQILRISKKMGSGLEISVSLLSRKVTYPSALRQSRLPP